MENNDDAVMDPLEAILVRAPFVSSHNSIQSTNETYLQLIDQINQIQSRIIEYRDKNKDEEGMLKKLVLELENAEHHWQEFIGSLDSTQERLKQVQSAINSQPS